MVKSRKILAFTISICMLLTFGTSTFAKDTNLQIADGEHKITIKATKLDSNEPSGVAGFIEEEATLLIKDGLAQLILSLPAQQFGEVTGLQIDGKEPVAKNKVDTINQLTFELPALKDSFRAQVQYKAGTHEGDQPFTLRLIGLEKLPVKEDENKDETFIDLSEGNYIIGANYLKDNEDSPSSMSRYLGEAIFLSVKEEMIEVTITINDNETVTKLRVNGQDAVEKVVDENKRYETFRFHTLNSKLNAYVEYEAPFQGKIHKGQANFRIAFNSENIKAATTADKPGYGLEDKNDEEKNDNDNGIVTNPDRDTSKPNDKQNSKEEKNKLIPDKAYQVNYVIKHESEDKLSSADAFFTKPAVLLYKNNEVYVQLTITNSSMIDSLQTKYGDVVLVKKNGDGSMVVQFKVDKDLTKVNPLNMHITVPGMYSMKHQARLFFDPNSLEEVNASNYLLVAANNSNGPSGNGQTGETITKPDKDKNIQKPTDEKPSKNNNDSPKKPEFGTNETVSDTASNADNNTTDNPKTGDTTNVLFYTFLLIVSSIPLAWKMKKHFQQA